MTGFRPTGYVNGVMDTLINPGDIMLGGENVLAGGISTVGNGTLIGSAIATGIINRTGPTGAFTDTTDTAANILTALAGNSQGVDAVAGTSFRVRYINTVAFAMTLAAGQGVKFGAGTTTVAASTIREYLFTILSTQPRMTLAVNTVNGSPNITFVLPPGVNAYPQGPSPFAVNIQTGASVIGTGIAAGSTVIGVTSGQGGIIGLTLSANATATSPAGGSAPTFAPTIQIDSLGTLGL